ncbi:MAG: hypothetical protein HYY24_24810 [Verrucomicrobia bacterium]|nr:hypothetical protein [Verrucomicrobiota bacterium]
MTSYYTEAVVEAEGHLTLQHLPFARGQPVQILIAARGESATDLVPLKGSVVRYDRPFEAVADADWEAAK